MIRVMLLLTMNGSRGRWVASITDPDAAAPQIHAGSHRREKLWERKDTCKSSSVTCPKNTSEISCLQMSICWKTSHLSNSLLHFSLFSMRRLLISWGRMTVCNNCPHTIHPNLLPELLITLCALYNECWYWRILHYIQRQSLCPIPTSVFLQYLHTVKVCDEDKSKTMSGLWQNANSCCAVQKSTTVIETCPLDPAGCCRFIHSNHGGQHGAGQRSMRSVYTLACTDLTACPQGALVDSCCSRTGSAPLNQARFNRINRKQTPCSRCKKRCTKVEEHLTVAGNWKRLSDWFVFPSLLTYDLLRIITLAC